MSTETLNGVKFSYLLTDGKDRDPLTKEVWLEACRQCLSKFKWFIEKHFDPHKFSKLTELLAVGDVRKLMQLMTDIWWHLPASFNVNNEAIMNAGYRQFVILVDITDEQYKSITK